MGRSTALPIIRGSTGAERSSGRRAASQEIAHALTKPETKNHPNTETSSPAPAADSERRNSPHTIGASPPQAIPAFRDGNVEQGIRDTVERVAIIVLANHTLTAEERAAVDGSNDWPPALVTTPFFGLFIVFGFLVLIPFFNANRWVLAPLAIGMFALGWVKGGSDSWRQSMRGNGNEKSAGGKRGKASSASSSASSSFGGGRSGGGGASGSW